MLIIDAMKYPTLARMLRTGELTLDDRYVCGWSSDGVWVQLGQVYNDRDCENTELYLRDHPSPKDW